MQMPPQKETRTYNKEKWGYYGELGEGANAKIRFLQTVISYDELDDITLISNIPGSEKWDVRDLFQRDVDGERVTREIMPYLKDNGKVKFFNPLTFIVLPIAENGKDILKDVEKIEPVDENQNGTEFETYEKSGYYKFGITKHDKSWAKISWNTNKCYIVAIDGQHRLSALKRWKNEPAAGGELKKWRIPVVLLNIFKVDDNDTVANLLEIVRKTFVYINTEAVTVNKSRAILLNDESINSICVQELIQFSHSNDCKPIGERDESIMPLMFFDWRGETERKRQVSSPASMKSIDELFNWFDEYIIGEDGDEAQEIMLELQDLVPPLTCLQSDVRMTYEDTEQIRKQFRKTILPGFLHLMQNFIPYKEYIKECRDIERDAIADCDNAQHAFLKLRFGAHNAHDDQIEDVNEKFIDITERLEDAKSGLPELISREIGMRGIVFAFGIGKDDYEECFDDKVGWLDYAVWITGAINKVYKDGWFFSFDKLEPEKRKILTHLVFDEAGTIINYRLDKASDALGALLVLLIFKERWDDESITDEQYQNIWNYYSESVGKTYNTGFKKSIKGRLKDDFHGTQAEFNAEVKKRANTATKKRINSLGEFLGI